MKYSAFLMIYLIFSVEIISQNIAINSTGAVAHSSAMLDISSVNTGLLIPRVTLTATNNASPVTGPATSLLVFNTATVNDVTPGYYYWSGSAWIRLYSGTVSAWNLTGNSGTNPTSNFVGTSDNQDFVIRTNNTERLRVSNDGNVGIGTSGPWSKLNIKNGRTVIEYDAGFVYPGATFEYQKNPWLYLWRKETTLTAGQGGNIIFTASSTTTGTAADICMIEGARENATNNNTASYFSFYTRPTSGNWLERLRINSTGYFEFKPENASNRTILFNALGSGGGGTEPTIVPSSDQYGFLGTSTRRWYRVYAMGGFIDGSSREWKRNIEPLTQERKKEIYDIVKNLTVNNYDLVRLERDSLENIIGESFLGKTFGLIAEDSPQEITDYDRKGIKLYEYISMLAIALQEAQNRIAKLEEALKNNGIETDY